MILSQPLWLLALAAIAPVTIWLRYPGLVRHPLAFLLSQLKQYKMLRSLPLAFLMAAEICAVVALCRPQRPVAKSNTVTVKGRDIMIALDFSPSMSEKVEGKLPERRSRDPFFDGAQAAGKATVHEGVWRLDIAQLLILNFVDLRDERQEKMQQSENEKGDAIGLIVFDHKPRLVWPLDRNLKQLKRQGNFVPRTTGFRGLGWGTNFGSEIPGPIDMAVEHMAKYGESRVRVLALVTDGENDLAPPVKKRLVNLLVSNHIHFYVIGVGGDIVKKQKKTGKQVDIAEVAEQAGGRVFIVQTADEMTACFAEFDSLESAPVPAISEQSLEELFWLPSIFALVFTGLWATSEAVLFGR
jgi:hypothetical protein